MVRNRTWPSPGAGSAYCSTRKFDALGSPTGRETRTTRFACWDMVVSSIIVIARSVVTKQFTLLATMYCFAALAMTVNSRRDLCQRRVECGGGSRQILEGADLA